MAHFVVFSTASPQAAGQCTSSRGQKQRAKSPSQAFRAASKSAWLVSAW